MTRMLLLALTALALAGCTSRTAPPPPRSGEDPRLVSLWQDTWHVAHAIEGFLQKHKRLPEDASQIADRLPSRLARERREMRLTIGWKKLPKGENQPSDPEQPFQRVQVLLRRDDRKIAENYDILNDPRRETD